MKPILFYVDDEPHNLVVFEAACPEDWEVHTFDSGIAALEKIDSVRPHVILSDQRMPGMTGVQFLELAKKLLPHAIRIIVTGYSDEDLVVESVRKAGIFDYFKKPWDVDDLISSLSRATEFYRAEEESRRLQKELEIRERELRESNENLSRALKDLELAQGKERELRSELECWVPPFVLWSIQQAPMAQSMKKNLFAIAFDIIESNRLHDVSYKGRPMRGRIIQIFTEAVLRHGGWRESHSGDSAYGHFGLMQEGENAAEAALAAAREFRVGLKSLSDISGIEIECGISLHVAPECPVFLHTVQLQTPRGTVTQKSFDTSSADVDLLHRMEKLMHELPGSNIVMSGTFVEKLKNTRSEFIQLGAHLFHGQKEPVELYLIPSASTQGSDIKRIVDEAVANSKDDEDVKK